MSYLNFVAHFENDYEWNEEKKEYQPFAQCPDQGTHELECCECKAKLNVDGTSPNDDLEAYQQTLDENNDEYPYDRAILKDSKFYPVEEGVEDGCDTCDNTATHQTFGSDDELYLACIPCLYKHKLPIEEGDKSLEEYERQCDDAQQNYGGLN
jgi:hypothetical protein